MTGACGTTGGIATHNLNMLHALADLTTRRGIEFHVLSFLEKESDRPEFLPADAGFLGFHGDRRSLVQDLIFAATRRPILCFDHVTLALPLLPFAATGWVKTVIVAHGSESWRKIRPT